MGGKILTEKTPKTWKREVAGAMLVVLGVLTYRMFWGIDVTEVPAYENLYNSTMWAVLMFAAAAFGIDAFLKQRS